MATKNIFAGTGTKTTFVNIIYGELMKREFVTLADILCIYHKREKGYYEKMSCCSETGYGELKKAFPEVVKELRNVYPESVEDNGKIGKGRAYRYVGKDDDPLAEERKAVEQKRLEDYVAFCKASAGILPSSWFSAYFENTQLLLDTHREDEGGMSHIRSSLEQNLTNIDLLPVFYKAITDKQVLRFSYQRFGQESFTLTFHPQFLKEYNGRWFVFGEYDDGCYGEVTLTIEPNRELRGKILAYGQYLEVMSPHSLREQIEDILKLQIHQYLSEKKQ